MVGVLAVVVVDREPRGGARHLPVEAGHLGGNLGLPDPVFVHRLGRGSRPDPPRRAQLRLGRQRKPRNGADGGGVRRARLLAAGVGGDDRRVDRSRPIGGLRPACPGRRDVSWRLRRAVASDLRHPSPAADARLPAWPRRHLHPRLARLLDGGHERVLQPLGRRDGLSRFRAPVPGPGDAVRIVLLPPRRLLRRAESASGFRAGARRLGAGSHLRQRHRAAVAFGARHRISDGSPVERARRRVGRRLHARRAAVCASQPGERAVRCGDVRRAVSAAGRPGVHGRRARPERDPGRPHHGGRLHLAPELHQRRHGLRGVHVRLAVTCPRDPSRDASG